MPAVRSSNALSGFKRLRPCQVKESHSLGVQYAHRMLCYATLRTLSEGSVHIPVHSAEVACARTYL